MIKNLLSPDVMAHLRIFVALAALVMLVPFASAQAANDPKVTVTMAVSPSTTPTIALGSSAVYNVTISVQADNLVCNGKGTVEVKLAQNSTGLAGVTGELPASVSVELPANFPPTGGSLHQTGNAAATFTVTVSKTTMGNHDHSFTLTATTPNATPSGCQILSTTAPPASTATATVALKTGAAPVIVSTATGGNMTMTGTGSTTTKKSSFVPVPLEMAALMAIVLVGRRLLR